MDLLFLEQLKIKQEMQTEWESGMMADSKGLKVGTEPSAAAQTRTLYMGIRSPTWATGASPKPAYPSVITPLVQLITTYVAKAVTT